MSILPESLSVHWNVSLPMVVPESASIIRYIRANNIESAQALFQGRRASPLDVLSDGTSLLHVRPLLFTIDKS